MRVIALATGLLVAASATAADDLVAFRAEARVELDASGKPMKVEASKDLPEGIRSYIEKRVRAYSFSPPARDGASGPAVTYLALGACAVPVEGGYRMGLDLKGNGPRLTKRGVPEYPRDAVRVHAQARITMQLLVAADGSAKAEQIDYADPKQPARRAFSNAIENWVRQMKFDPEQLDGRPVATRVEYGVDFVLPEYRNLSELEAQVKQKYSRAPECLVASGEAAGHEPVALDSPVTVTPTSG